MSCSLVLLGRMWIPGSPGTLPRYMLSVMVGAGSGWRRCKVHGVGRVVVLTSGPVDAVWGDVYGEGSDGAL